MSYYDDGAVDQFKLPTVAVVGQELPETLLTKDFEAWAARRTRQCGHPQPVPSCQVCQGTLRVSDAISFGLDGVNLLPAR